MPQEAPKDCHTNQGIASCFQGQVMAASSPVSTMLLPINPITPSSGCASASCSRSCMHPASSAAVAAAPAAGPPAPAACAPPGPASYPPGCSRAHLGPPTPHLPGPSKPSAVSHPPTCCCHPRPRMPAAVGSAGVTRKGMETQTSMQLGAS